MALRPERLGGRTTIIFGFRILPHDQPVPSPLIEISLFYPRNIGLVTSGLGLETCAATQLELLRPMPTQTPSWATGRRSASSKSNPEILTEEGRHHHLDGAR